jgi:hypothetical protein
LLYETLAPAEKRFLAGDLRAVDEIIRFLGADISVSRSGCRKKRFYRRFKALKLNLDQVERLQDMALKPCESDMPNCDGLMIRLADREFIQPLRACLTAMMLVSSTRSR